jgi:chromosome segregation ATPase
MSENTENQTICEVVDQGAQIISNEIDLVGNNATTHEAVLKTDNDAITQLQNELKIKDNELVKYKTQITQLEEEVSEAQKFKAQHLKEAEEIEALKTKSEDILTKAKGMLFEKTKVIKNQELQIDALNQQITSLKDVVSITKDLLEIRNLEIKQLESKIQTMEDKVGAEKERHDLMHKKLEHMIRYNGELKREYETQLCLFSALRERYNERELAKGVLATSTPAPGTSTAASTASTVAPTTSTEVSTASTAPTSTVMPVASTATTSTSTTNEASTGQVNGEVQEEIKEAVKEEKQAGDENK